MRKLVSPVVGVVAIALVAAGLPVAAGTGVLPGTALTFFQPLPWWPAIIERPLAGSESELLAQATSDEQLDVSRFEVNLPGTGFELWGEAYAHGRSLGHAFDEPQEWGRGNITLALTRADASESAMRMGVRFPGAYFTRTSTLKVPFSLSGHGSMSGTLHQTPTALNAGEAVPLLWLVANEGPGLAPLPDQMLDDKVAAVADPNSFTDYDYALVVWFRPHA